jgi:primosomal protein N' (replication factor Y)
VAVDVSLPHLDRPFDYLVPQRFSEQAVPGCRVRVRFAGRLADGYLLQRAAVSEHQGALAFLERVVSPEPVLTPEIAGLARAVADRYGGTLADVLRLAIPPRHAGVESGRTTQPGVGSGPEGLADVGSGSQGLAGVGPGPRDDRSRSCPGRPEPGPWARYPVGRSFLAALAEGRAPRAAWSALPGRHWPDEIAVAAATALAAGHGALVVVPDTRDLGLVDAALARALGTGQHVCLAAGLGPAERYRRWLRIARGEVRVAAGTRSAMFAPVAGLGLVVIWDDGDDLHAEPRAPYPHAREVLALRAHRGGGAMLLGGFARTTEVTQLVAGGWAAALAADRATVRRCAPQVSPTGEDAELARDQAARSARMPSLALRAAREALASGPVLFQVPRRGYVVAVACEHCGARARCPGCGGPVSLPAVRASARCGWCGLAAGTECGRCGQAGLRALVVGAGRTAEELGRAFPATPVRTSGGAEVIATVGRDPAVIVATPGAEPLAEGGYAAAVLLDGWALLGRASLRAGEEALRRWLNAAALVRSGTDGGRVVIVADATLAAVQALVRWDPVTHSERELAERTELRFPPAIRLAALTGPERSVRDLLAAASLPAAAEVLGPVPAVGSPGRNETPAVASLPEAPEPAVRMLVRVDRGGGTQLAGALRAAQALRSARKDAGPVRLQLDPAEVL